MNELAHTDVAIADDPTAGVEPLAGAGIAGPQRRMPLPAFARQLLRNPKSAFGIAVFTGIVLVSIAAPLLTMWKEREPEYAKRKQFAGEDGGLPSVSGRRRRLDAGTVALQQQMGRAMDIEVRNHCREMRHELRRRPTVARPARRDDRSQYLETLDAAVLPPPE